MGYNSILLYFVAQTVLTSVTGSSFSWLFCPFDTLPIIMFYRFLCVCFCTFLVAHVSSSSCIFTAPVLNLSFLQGAPGSFYWNQDLRFRYAPILVLFSSHIISNRFFILASFWCELETLAEEYNPLNFYKLQTIVKSKQKIYANNFHYELSKTNHQACCIVNQHNIVTTELNCRRILRITMSFVEGHQGGYW